MNFKSTFFLFALCLVGFGALAQKGTIRGVVYEDATGEQMIGVTALIPGTSIGAITDFDGAFQLNVEPGIYNLKLSFVSFETITISDVEVKAGEVTLFDNIRMREAVEELEAVVVSASVIRNSETALLTIKKKSSNLLDGISAQSFRKIGDGNAASAIKRVTGVSVEGGKYVYVRGLGDRYTKTILNGVDIPGLDPDRNALQMDIFPTNIIDNIMVMKSFTADLPADFTGGVVNIETKDFPEEKIFKLSGSLGYNPAMHFNDHYLDYKGGQTDWLGFDDGTRDIPTGRSTEIPFRTDALTNAQKAQEYNQILRNFDQTLGATRQQSAMDFSLGFSLGNQKDFDRFQLGYNVAFTYKNDTEFYEGATFNRFGKGNTSDILELDPRERQNGDYGINDVLVGGLAGLAIKTDNAKYKANLLHLQNGTSKSAIFDYIGSDQGSNFEAIQYNLEYSQRSLTNLLLSGKHYFGDKQWELEWKLSPTKSRIEDPDIRFTRFRTDGNGYSIGTESGIPERIWRYLEEDNYASVINVNREYELMGREAKLKFGGGHTYKQRNYEIQNFQIFTNGTELTGDPNDIFHEENLFSEDNRDGVTYDPQFLPINPNLYDANINNSSLFVSNEFEPTSRLKTIIGLRAEKYSQRYTGINQSGDQYNNLKVLDALDLFPTANFIYKLTETQNLRFSYSRTIARPSFKEASFATIIDPITGRTFIGGFFPDIDVTTGEQVWDGNLTETRINNYDFRWEAFQKGGQTVSISGFYKTFDDPIEMVQYVQATNNFQPRNVGDGKVIGAEFEFRQNLGFAGRFFENLTLSSNVTITDSEIEMSETEYRSRINNAREGEEINNTRDMAGQAPFLINAGLSYVGQKGLEAGVFYNVQGETLQYVGIADRPDVYSVPFHSLNINVMKTFGAQDQMNLGLKVNNLLNDYKEQVFQSYGTNDELFSSIRPATSFSLSFGYKF